MKTEYYYEKTALIPLFDREADIIQPALELYAKNDELHNIYHQVDQVATVPLSAEKRVKRG